MLRAVFLLLLLGQAFINPALAAERHPYNVILISLDTLSADHMGVYGYFRDTTPFLGKFARENVIFDQAFSQAGYSLASHFSMFTGVTHSRHGIWTTGRLSPTSDKTPLDPRIRTLTQYLKEKNYYTKWLAVTGARFLDLDRGLNRGFDELTAFDFGEKNERPRLLDFGPPGKRPSLPEHLKALVGKKFFLFMHTYAMHVPYHPPSQYEALYDPSFTRKLVLEFQRPPSASKMEELNVMREKWNGQFDFNNSADRIHYKALYDGTIRGVDDALGRLIASLKELGLYDNTLIVLTGDHGEAFWEHGNFGHGNTYYEELHVPLIMKLPGFEAKRVHDPVLSIDIVPTVLDVLGLKADPGVEGKSLVPLLRGKPFARKGYSYSHGVQFTAIWDEKWKLMRANAGSEVQLYNRALDPYERENVAQANPKIVLKMKSALSAYEAKKPKPH